MAAGAASLSDSSMNSPGTSSSSSSRPDGRSSPSMSSSSVPSPADVLTGRATRGRGGGRTPSGVGGVAQHLFGDEQGLLDFDDRLGRRLEQDDVVRALTMAIDRVGQAAAPPRGDLPDLAAGRHDAAGGPVDESLAFVVRHVGADDEHEFVAAQGAQLLPMGMPR